MTETIVARLRKPGGLDEIDAHTIADLIATLTRERDAYKALAERAIPWLRHSALQPSPNAIGSGEDDPNTAPIEIADEITNLSSKED